MTEQTPTPAQPSSPLFRLAVLYGVNAVVSFYIRRGEDVNARDNLGRSPLILAAARGRFKTCRLLLEMGADPWLKDNEGKNALVIAGESNKAKVERVLREFMISLSKEDLVTNEATESDDSPHGAPEDNTDQELDLSAWEEVHDSPQSPIDPSYLEQASEIQKRISQHTPIDTGEDWSDIDVYFPEHLLSHQHKSLYLDAELLEAIRKLILAGLLDSRVPADQISALIPDDSDDEGEISSTIQSALRLVLGEIGVLVDEGPGGPDISDLPEDGSSDDDERLADEALDFFTSILIQWEEEW